MAVTLTNPQDLPRVDVYHQVAVATGTRQVFVAGQVSWDADGVTVGVGDLAAQVEQSYANVATALRHAGAGVDDLVRLTFYVVDWTPDKMPALLDGLSRAANRLGSTATPPATLIGVAALDVSEHLVEIEATAVVGDRPAEPAEAGPRFFVTPGYGDRQLARMGYSQAIRIGDRVETSGQGGWDDDLDFPADLEDEIVQAFDNVERTLLTAGATWRDVVHVNSYHVPETPGFIGETHNRVMVEQLRARTGDRAPIWTETGVPALGAPGMRVEIRVTAIIGS
ncbi:Rid family hydrolase [Promicromonospora kroppenstedtii]|uniref:Rid family hydrolase n=1 Tax=Promicromonospora kroppenstedtii TaxID=440482 RepID=UPI0004B64321|nr:Rid family hydrolase [Promicromonospora kroppenstedtii]